MKLSPQLDEKQRKQFELLYDLYIEWNQKINVISRKDIENLYEHHVLHSLSIAKYIQFAPKTKVVDLGTGGGFPGVPLAIMFPEVSFTLMDGTKKKLKVIDEVCQAIEVKNATTLHQRAEEHKMKYDYMTCRAVADFSILKKYMHRLISNEHKQGIPNGMLALKGGEVKKELKSAGINHAEIIPITDYFEQDFFSNKHLIYIQI